MCGGGKGGMFGGIPPGPGGIPFGGMKGGIPFGGIGAGSSQYGVTYSSFGLTCDLPGP
jgi:hypothetical protein